MITAKGKITLGHGVNIVWCDVLGRRYYNQSNKKAEYFYPSFNHQGKRFDNLEKGETKIKIESLEEDLTPKLNLFGIDVYTPFRDTDIQSRQNTQKHFLFLERQEYIKKTDGRYWLDIPKIISRTNFANHINTINFYPNNQAKKRLEDLIKNINGCYPISKPRNFATEIEASKNSNQKINPIFDLAVSPLLLSQFPNDYAIECSRALLHGVFLPILIWSALFNKPFSKKIYIHGFVNCAGLMDISQFSNQINAGILNSDIIRYCAIQGTRSFEDVDFGLERIGEAKKVLYRTTNMAKHILKHRGIQKELREENKEVGGVIDALCPALAIDLFKDEIIEISQRTRENTLITEQDLKKYLESINSISSLFPVTIKRVKEIIYNGKI